MYDKRYATTELLVYRDAKLSLSHFIYIRVHRHKHTHKLAARQTNKYVRNSQFAHIIRDIR